MYDLSKELLYLAAFAGVDTVVLAAGLVPAYGAHVLRIRQRVTRRIVPALYNKIGLIKKSYCGETTFDDSSLPADL
jgi:hypothetical protein